jgi:enoyl-CoA hydratase/carnithine racemase
MRRTHRIIRLMVAGRVPIVAAVEGWCVGRGLSIACASDTIVSAEDARFMAGFGKVGLIADLGLPFTLPARIGAGRARQLFLYGRQLGAARRSGSGWWTRWCERPSAGGRDGARALPRGAGPLPIADQAGPGGRLDRALEEERHFQTPASSRPTREGKARSSRKREPSFSRVDASRRGGQAVRHGSTMTEFWRCPRPRSPPSARTGPSAVEVARDALAGSMR